MNANTHEHIDVAIIGTGFSGLGMAIKLKQSGNNDFVVLEAASDLGGTWRDNHYPGCACDVQSHLYSFSFEPNPNWSRMFAPQPEIWAYLRHCAKKYQITSHIRYNARVDGAQWDETAQAWHIRTADGKTLSARVLVSGIGGLSRANTPDIKGLEKFNGEVFHSQQWHHDYPLAGKKVAVIGTGASAIQFVPKIAPEVAELKLFQRTPPWIIAKPDRAITWAEHTLFKRLPAAQLALRNAIYWQLESRAVGFVINPRLMKLAERWARSHIRKQVSDPALRKKVTPDYTIGCKRILISDDYYPALGRDNVDLVTDGIREIKANSIVTADGAEHQVDAIIFGTGFAATDPLGPLQITGSDGVDLREEFMRTGTEAYLGTTVAGFPNLFMLTGPNTGLGHNSMVFMIESQVAYVMDALKTMQKKDLAAIEVRRGIQEKYNAKLQSGSTNSVWKAGGCQSWYLDASGKNVTLWPGFTWQFRRQTACFKPGEYRLTQRVQTPAHAQASAA